VNYVIFSALGALTFSGSSILQRRAVVRVIDATSGVLVTVPLATGVYLLMLLIMGQVGSILDFPWQSYGWLSAAGIIHFVAGRSIRYYLVQISGSNIANIVTKFNSLVSVVLAVTLLGEPLSWELVLGVLLIVTGLTIAGLNSRMPENPLSLSSGVPGSSRVPGKVYLLGLGIGLAWGVSPIMIKLGLGSSGSPVAGAFIMHAAATIALSPALFNITRRDSLVTMSRGAFGYFCLTGLFSAAAQLMRFIALSLGPVSVVTPVFATSPIFALFLAFIFNRKLEIFSRNVVIGTVVVIVGALLLA